MARETITHYGSIINRAFTEPLRKVKSYIPQRRESVVPEGLERLVLFQHFLSLPNTKRELKIIKVLGPGWRQALTGSPAAEKISLVNIAYQRLVNDPKANFAEEFDEVAKKIKEYYAEDPIKGKKGIDYGNPITALSVFARNHIQRVHQEQNKP